MKIANDVLLNKVNDVLLNIVNDVLLKIANDVLRNKDKRRVQRRRASPGPFMIL